MARLLLGLALLFAVSCDNNKPNGQPDNDGINSIVDTLIDDGDKIVADEQGDDAIAVDKDEIFLDEKPDMKTDDTTTDDDQSDETVDTEQPDESEDIVDIDTVDEMPDTDTNECVPGDWKIETGVVSECVSGQWVLRRITKQWGTTSEDQGRLVEVDGAGNLFVTGYTTGSLDGNTRVGGRDIFLTKWNADGTKTWTKQWGTANWDDGYSVAVDGEGNIFVTGYTGGGLDGNTNAGGGDIFLTKWNADGTKAWTKQWGTTSGEDGYSVAVDGAGNLFVTGATYGGLDGNTSAGEWDIFLTKWNTDGTKEWTKQWGTTNWDYGYSVAVDGEGNIFVTGYTGGGLDGNTNAGGYGDVFLTKWAADGTKAWTKQWGTTGDDFGWSVAVDGAGNFFVTGYTAGGLDGNTSAGGDDIFLTKWNADGTKVWTKQWGTTSGEDGYSVAVDGAGNLFVTGYTYGGLDGNTSAGGYGDIFLTKWLAE